jgi:hypothetical protein
LELVIVAGAKSKWDEEGIHQDGKHDNKESETEEDKSASSSPQPPHSATPDHSESESRSVSPTALSTVSSATPAVDETINLKTFRTDELELADFNNQGNRCYMFMSRRFHADTCRLLDLASRVTPENAMVSAFSVE